jgi:hypothetical protein
MAFFAGYPNGHPGHDNIAEKIAANSVRFTREHWRWEDMQAYVSLCVVFLPMFELTSDPIPCRCSASCLNMHDYAQMTEMRRPSTWNDQYFQETLSSGWLCEYRMFQLVPPLVNGSITVSPV